MIWRLSSVQSSKLLVTSILVLSEGNVKKHLSLCVDWRYRSHKFRRGIYPRILDRAGYNSVWSKGSFCWPFKRTVPKRVVCCGSWFLAVKKINKIFKQLALKSNLDLWKCVCRTFELAKFFQESNQNLHEDQYLKPFLLSPYRAFVNFKRMLVKIRFDTIKITPFLFSVLLLSASPLECFDPERCINSKSKSANISNQRAHWSHVSFAVHIHHNEAWSVRRRKGVPR